MVLATAIRAARAVKHEGLAEPCDAPRVRPEETRRYRMPSRTFDVGVDLERLQRWSEARGFACVTTRSPADHGEAFDVTLRQKRLLPSARNVAGQV